MESLFWQLNPAYLPSNTSGMCRRSGCTANHLRGEMAAFADNFCLSV
ncbi:hypothetical protein SAMN04487996_112205 [Dyadobacter soli]|uniref:Uncharacterized protein n=1 Tax=Dyadobacter soli TaxID=659014 RepID=A0A1G7NYP2_9BACT|nr:hypothetical protein [Dyadobacter soli]SDF79091.1 hypothetical protein SAMN04487996_112205 [Dyadobacter soli]